ncbi:MAG: hypothetical protein AAF460_06055 [Pseudomonadota bacterium]
MGRLLAVALALPVALATAAGTVAVAATGSADRARWHLGVEAAAADFDGLPSWVDGSVGKFAAHGTEPPVRGYGEHRRHLSDTVSATLVLEATADGIGDPVNATEAYLHWAPVPRSETRYRIKVGAFYPALSLENTRAGWRSPYTINYSAINTWVAEELRSTGLEVTAIKRLPSLGPRHRLILQGSVFGGNDPAGSLLSWRGWAIHDRQTRFGDNLPLPPLPLNRPGQMFDKQAAVVEPFMEVDNRLGFTAAAEWQARGRFALKGLYYDNRGDPEALENGQYGWDTRFWSVGARLAFPKKVTLLAQWMQGNTGMGPLMSGKHAIDNNFESHYLLLSRKLGPHRLSARYDRFRVDDVDIVTADDNNERGSAWTLAHRFTFSERMQAATEWARIETSRANLVFNGFRAREVETLFQIRLQLAL